MSRITLILASLLIPSRCADWRALSEGELMLADKYLDQPYCVVLTINSPGRWACIITRNSLPEGNTGEHVEVLTSDDEGHSWSAGVRLEAVGSVTNAYGNIIEAQTGRLYVVYNRNSDNVTTLPNSTAPIRNDELGHFVMRWSDDGGSSWSSGFQEVPYRSTWVDGNNSFGGKVKMMWSVDQIKTVGTRTWHAFTKIGKLTQAPPEESFFLSSPNLLTAASPADVTWELYPNGEVGIAAPWSGMQWEEAHIVPLASGGFFTLCRTNVGYLGTSATADATASAGWSTSTFARYWSALPAAAGSLLKNPEGPITLKRFDSRGGRFLLLYYNNALPGYCSGGSGSTRPCRNPVWLASGREEGGEVLFSQPELALFDAVPMTAWLGEGIGYPDFVESASGRISITETNKTHARVHPIDGALLAALFAQDSVSATPPGAALTWAAADVGRTFSTPPLPDPSAPATAGAGLSICLWLKDYAAVAPGANETLIDAGAVRLTVSADARALLMDIRDAVGASAALATDAPCTGRLLTAGAHLVAFTVDTSAHIMTASVDGALCDGGAAFEFGFEWLPLTMASLQPAAETTFALAEGYHGRLLGGAWYARALLTSEVVGLWRVGPPSA